MIRTLIVIASLTATVAVAGCGGGSSQTHALTVPPSAMSKTLLPNIEPVRGKDYESQALEGSIARWVQWGNLNFGRTILDRAATNDCQQQVEDLWVCTVTINVVKPFKGYNAGPLTGGYTVTRDTEKNQLIYISGR